MGIANEIRLEKADDFYLTVELAECIPKSSIVFNQTEDFERKASRLYRKYIRIGSEFEININYSLRKQLMDRFDTQSNSNSNEQRDELHSVFDKCCKEMTKLLRFSLTRFKTKPEYLRLQGLNENYVTDTIILDRILE